MTDTYINVERLTLFKQLLYQYLAPIQHDHSSEHIIKMTGYVKAETAADISANDSLNVAIGKLEKALDSKGTSNLTIGTTATTAAAGNHTHTISISTSEGTSQRTLEYGGKYVLTAGGSSFVFTMPQATSSSVTSVAGKTGAVTLEKSDVGLGNVGNFKAVSTEASQGLSTTEKTNARNNIGAGTSNLALGDTATTAAAGNHTHTLSIATSEGTSSLTLAYDSKYVLTAGGSTFIFKMPAGPSYPVTSVAGKTGAVTLDKSDVGLGNVGNFKAVSTVANQGLTSTEKSNARSNIGAGTSNLALGTTASTAAAGNHTHSEYATKTEAYATGLGLEISTWPASKAASDASTTFHNHLRDTDTACGRTENQIDTSTTIFVDPSISIIYFNTTNAQKIRYVMPSGDADFPNGKRITLVGNFYTGEKDAYSDYAIDPYGYSRLIVANPMADAGTSPTLTNFSSIADYADSSSVHVGRQYSMEFIYWNKKWYSKGYETTLAINEVSPEPIKASLPVTGGAVYAYLIACDYASKSYVGTNYSSSSHTHSTSIASSTGTSSLTLAYGSKYSLTAGGTSFVFTMPAGPSYPVTSVAGKTGAVTLSSSDVGLGNVGNFKAVSTVADQGLTSTEKSNARANIGAGTSNLAIGTTASTAAAGNHTHSLSIATSTGTSSLTLAHGGKYVLTAGGSTYIFTMPAGPSYPVTSVAGKTGAVTLSSSDVGLGNVGNFKAVSTVASQGLSATEKTNARNNIAAASTLDALKKCSVCKTTSDTNALWVKVGTATVNDTAWSDYECTMMISGNWGSGSGADRIVGIFKVHTRAGETAGVIADSAFRWVLRPANISQVIWDDSIRGYYYTSGTAAVVDIWVCLQLPYISFDLCVLTEGSRGAGAPVSKMSLISSNVSSSTSPTGTQMTIYDAATFRNTVAVAGQATNDSDGNAINSTYLKLAGDTMNTGATITTSIVASGYTRSSIWKGDNLSFYGPTGGGWANAVTFRTYSDDATKRFHVGCYGDGETVKYGFMGSAYNTPIMKLKQDVGIGVAGKVTVGMTSDGGSNIAGGVNLVYNSSNQSLDFTFN